MKKERTREEQLAIEEGAERQMRREQLAQRIQERLVKQDAVEELATRPGPYIAISRESGSGGGQIARLVGEKLGWDVLDKELLDDMAERYHMPRDMLEFVDETTTNWVRETFGKFVGQSVVDQEDFVSHLGTIVLLAAQHGRMIVVGRGAQFLLPRERGLAVRIIAPESYRIEETMRRRALSREEAKRYVEDTDRGRRDFVLRYFHHDVATPHCYDLVINTEKLGVQGTADLIVIAFEKWFKEKEAQQGS